MMRSTHRILTTHAGSLPRPDDVRALVTAKAGGQPYQADKFNAGSRCRHSHRASFIRRPSANRVGTSLDTDINPYRRSGSAASRSLGGSGRECQGKGRRQRRRLRP